jgi:D-xylulose reductase
VHGCLAPYVVHPAAFTYALPDNVSFGEGAMVEPFAIGMQAAIKARLQPGDVAVVTGCGTIGIVTALAALAGGCSRVFISDVLQEKLDIAGRYPGITPVNLKQQDLAATVRAATEDWGADVIFEASGSPAAYKGMFDFLRPGGCVVLIGIPIDPAPFDVAGAQAHEARVETVFRYANIYPRAIALIASGKVDLKPLISGTFAFDDAIQAIQRAAEGRGGDVKLQIQVAKPSGA